MNTLMLVDDEYMILKGIPKLLDWSEINIEIVKAEKSPLAALEFLKNNPVDILISDMNMAELPGTKFLPAVKKIQPDIQIIILSGYEDFSYAKTGLEQGVVDYLNKPVDPDDLQNAVEKAQRRIKKSKNIKHQAQMASRIQVRDVLHGKLPLATLTEASDNYAIIGLIDVQDNITQILQKLDFVLGYQEDNNNVYAIITYASDNLSLVKQKVADYCENMIIDRLFANDDVVANGRKIEALANKLVFYQLEDQVIDLNEKVTPLAVADFVSKLELNNLSAADFDSYLQEIYHQLGLHQNEIKDAKYFSRLVLMKMYGEHHEINLDFAALIAQIENTENISELSDILNDFFAQYRKNHRKYPEVIEQVIDYVADNYNQELSLKKVADIFHINSVYLGSIFKKNVGQSFAKYLNSYRISRSIEIMSNSHYDINEISEMVGYRNNNYFFRVFKEQTKMAPSEYRKMVIEKEE